MHTSTIQNFIRRVLQESKSKDSSEDDYIAILEKWRDKFQYDLMKRSKASHKKSIMTIDDSINVGAPRFALYWRLTTGNIFIAGLGKYERKPKDTIAYNITYNKNMLFSYYAVYMALDTFEALINLADTLDEFDELALQADNK